MTPTTQLYLAYFPDTPSLDEFDVKQIEQREFLGSDGTFTVIGSSHYIAIPELEYHEILSCKPLTREEVKTISLEHGYNDTFTHEACTVTVETFIEAQKLSEFPGPDVFDISYRFAPDAYTTIGFIDENTYETYHTYPEHDLAIYTKTKLTKRSNTVQVNNEQHGSKTAPVIDGRNND
jgi:hypothetical protein